MSRAFPALDPRRRAIKRVVSKRASRAERAEPSAELEVQQRVCRVCAANRARYECPRCGLPYCSLACFRDHGPHGKLRDGEDAGSACTEAFYRERVGAVQTLMSKDPAVQDERQRERQRMRKLLQEYEDACDRGVGPEADADDDLERFRGDLDAVSYARLSAGERERFAKALQDGSLMRLVQLWEPWWAQQGSLLVEELGEEAGDAALPVSLAELRSLERPAAIQLGRRALENAAIRYQAVDLIAAYACAMRIVNGEADEETLGEFVKLAVALSPTLVDTELRYSGRTHLVEVLGENRKRNQVLTLGAAGSQRDLLEDARQICATRNGCLVAVRHLKVLFDRLVDNFDRMKAEGGDVDHGVKQTKKLARRASKKIEYHFFWLREATRNMIGDCAFLLK
uniref:HIT-type domain-containing protein n=1 Tax=Pinguiococcus pyrenoidosus TaxID=172671 RepID=A0A7R9U8W5_9STRA